MHISVDFLNPFVLIYLIGTFVSFVINQSLEFIDYLARKKNCGHIPDELKTIAAAQAAFDTEKLEKICQYENAKYFNMIPSSALNLVLNIVLVLFGFYPCCFNRISNLVGFPSNVGNSFVCFGLFVIIASIPNAILGLPFELYREFHTEKKFGFSNMTVKLWISDKIKGIAISLVIGALLIFVSSVFFIKFPDTWWLILAAIIIVFTFIMQIVFPKFIAPLFNKFEPLPEGEVKDKITAILKKNGFKNGGLFVMDASKRSGHSNAYFSGFGKIKRIVLYDTLIKSLTPDELASVLGHELGHCKLHHITKKICIMIPLEFIVTFALYKLAQFPTLYSGFGFTGISVENVSAVQFIGLFLATAIYGSVSEILSPFVNFFSRRDEYAADAYAKKVCGTGDDLISGLIKLNSENLSELLPSKLYAIWNYSHPTLAERVGKLK